jgi:hypothetical protein
MGSGENGVGFSNRGQRTSPVPPAPRSCLAPSLPVHGSLRARWRRMGSGKARCPAGLSGSYGPPRLQAVCAFCPDPSAPTYPVSGPSPGQDGDPRPGPHNFAGVIAPIPTPGFQSTGRRQAISLPPPADIAGRAPGRARPILWPTMPSPASWRTAGRCAAPPRRSGPAWRQAPPRPCSHGPEPAGHAAIRPMGSRSSRASAAQLALRG